MTPNQTNLWFFFWPCWYFVIFFSTSSPCDIHFSSLLLLSRLVPCYTSNFNSPFFRVAGWILTRKNSFMQTRINSQIFFASKQIKIFFVSLKLPENGKRLRWRQSCSCFYVEYMSSRINKNSHLVTHNERASLIISAQWREKRKKNKLNRMFLA